MSLAKAKSNGRPLTASKPFQPPDLTSITFRPFTLGDSHGTNDSLDQIPLDPLDYSNSTHLHKLKSTTARSRHAGIKSKTNESKDMTGTQLIQQRDIKKPMYRKPLMLPVRPETAFIDMVPSYNSLSLKSTRHERRDTRRNAKLGNSSSLQTQTAKTTSKKMAVHAKKQNEAVQTQLDETFIVNNTGTQLPAPLLLEINADHAQGVVTEQIENNSTQIKKQDTLHTTTKDDSQINHLIDTRKVGKLNGSELDVGAIYNTMAYISRCRRTTYGKSNRLHFLKAMFDTVTSKSACPVYPAAHHGYGEAKKLMLGSSITESAKNIHTLTNKSDVEAQTISNVFPTLAPASTVDIKLKQSIPIDPEAPKSIRDVIGIQGGNWRSQSSSHQNPTKNKSESNQLTQQANTRYSANREWHHSTHATVQASEQSHFFQPEKERWLHLPFVDDIGAAKRASYKFKLEHFVRDKNINSVTGLLRT
ncbi:hypothetical protein BDV3_005220 [Batrachochytrium dendrobatidis]